MKYSFLSILLFCTFQLVGQNDIRVFKDSRIINSVSTETLAKRKLDFRIGHKFGDFSGASGGWQTFYGLENASDVMIGFEYGLTDKLMIGISRTKGTDELRQNINLSTKIKLAQDGVTEGFPLSIAVYGLASISSMPKSTSSEPTISSFSKSAHRIVYHMQLMAAKKIANKLSLQFQAGFTYRNAVRSGDRNDIVSLGGAIKYQITKSFAVIGEGIFPFHETRALSETYFPATGFAVEWETGGGHTFQLNFTNSKGIMATDYIPYTRDNWSDGEYRLGFIISRLFTI